MAVLEIPLTPDNICAILSVTEQESGFRADPPVPNLGKIAWGEIQKRREKAGIPEMVVDAALGVRSKTGATYRERIEGAKTERQLSDVFEEMIDRVPLGRTFFADQNPVRTGGPMQVSVAFAVAHAKAKRYPYQVVESVRDEVFTRRGGMYFGIAHLLDYPAGYDRYLYRYADYNAGHYASRNDRVPGGAREVTGTKLALDGDLVPFGQSQAGETRLPRASLSARIGMDNAQIRRDLEQGKGREFEQTRSIARCSSSRTAAAVSPSHGLSSRRSIYRAPRSLAPSPRNGSPTASLRATAVSCAAREGRISRISWRLENDARSNAELMDAFVEGLSTATIARRWNR
jgi:hypothetical protein